MQFIPSRPWRPTLSPFARVGALLVTNVVMTVIAMALSFLASGPSTTSVIRCSICQLASMTPTTLNPFADQQIGAAILWVCGDFWCYPALVMALRLATKNDANSSAMDQVLRGRRSMTVRSSGPGARRDRHLTLGSRLRRRTYVVEDALSGATGGVSSIIGMR